MKKQYEKIEMEVVQVSLTDVVVASTVTIPGISGEPLLGEIEFP